jgi:hypothetical protein
MFGARTVRSSPSEFRTLADFPRGHTIHFLSLENGAAKEDGTVTFDEWLVYNGDCFFPRSPTVGPA